MDEATEKRRLEILLSSPSFELMAVAFAKSMAVFYVEILKGLPKVKASDAVLHELDGIACFINTAVNVIRDTPENDASILHELEKAQAATSRLTAILTD